MPIVTTYEWSTYKVRPGLWLAQVNRFSNGMPDGPVQVVGAEAKRERDACRVAKALLALWRLKEGENDGNQ